MRVCLVATHFAEYGFALAAALARHAEVLVIANGENTRAEIGDDFVRQGCEGINTHFMHKSRNPFRVLSQAWGLARAVRSFRPDILHVQEDTKDAFALALPWLGRVPLLLTVHDPKPHTGADTHTRNRTRHGVYMAQLRRRADALLVHGQRLVADVREPVGRRERPVFVMPHGPLGERAAHGLTAPQEPGRCLFFGRIEAYKGLRHFIDMVGRLNARGVAVRGVVAGRGSDLAPYRAQLQSGPPFELIEKFLSPAEVAIQFMRADVVVMPYENATQSGVAAYAIGIGRPVVAFDVGALCEMVHDGVTGLLVAPGDVAALAQTVESLIVDRSTNARLAAGAHLRGHAEFSWDHIAQDLLGIYHKLQRAD